MCKRPDARVYVIRLDSEVLKRAAFAKANPDHDPRKPCVYVGSTGLTPEERFFNHKARNKPGRFVPEFGVALMPKRYAHIPRMPRVAAEKRERELAISLRRRGYAVWGGSPGNADLNKAGGSVNKKAGQKLLAKPFAPRTPEERAEAFKLGAQLMDELLAGEHARVEFLNALDPVPDKAANDLSHYACSGRDGQRAWRALVGQASEQTGVTREGLARRLYGPQAEPSKVDEPLFMVAMYCFLSALPNLAALVEDFESASEGIEVLQAVWTFDWGTVRVPASGALELALDRLVSNM